MSLTARRHGLQSDSAYRFARGVDFDLPVFALERATQLLLDIVGGEAGPVIEVVDHGQLPKPPVILLRRTQIPRLLGIELSGAQVVEILESLGMKVTAQSEEGWNAGVPAEGNSPYPMGVEGGESGASPLHSEQSAPPMRRI